ncbi:hypothetical protein GQ54DRAFT_198956 [Martensiomyces pterosporus]|nr:hypothetical protein GQ54DRAFT_198956 [Martensiomyces pterosporus]
MTVSCHLGSKGPRLANAQAHLKQPRLFRLRCSIAMCRAGWTAGQEAAHGVAEGQRRGGWRGSAAVLDERKAGCCPGRGPAAPFCAWQAPRTGVRRQASHSGPKASAQRGPSLLLFHCSCCKAEEAHAMSASCGLRSHCVQPVGLERLPRASCASADSADWKGEAAGGYAGKGRSAGASPALGGGKLADDGKSREGRCGGECRIFGL